MTYEVSKKYRIEAILDALPYGERRIAMQELPLLLGVSKRQFYRILNMGAGDPSEAKPSQLLVISQFLGVTVDDLLTPQNQNTPTGV